MREADSPLAATQRRLWELIVAPEGVAAALRARPTPPLEKAVRSDAALDAQARLGVYANAYFERILHCLETDFAALRAVLDEDAFRDLATSYLAVHPPEHFSLRYAGARLADFLDDHSAGGPFRKRWPFCADLARLEWAIIDVFDAEDSPVARREDLAELAPERWAELELSLVPALRLIEVGWSVRGLRAAHEAGRVGDEPIDAIAARICVWRESECVFHRQLELAEASALRAVTEGASFGDLCVLAAQHLGEEPAAGEAAGWLAGWLDDGLLRSARVPSARGSGL